MFAGSGVFVSIVELRALHKQRRKLQLASRSFAEQTDPPPAQSDSDDDEEAAAAAIVPEHIPRADGEAAATKYT